MKSLPRGPHRDGRVRGRCEPDVNRENFTGRETINIMTAQTLALRGGRRLVTQAYPTKWMRVKRGLQLSGDLLKMLPWAMAGTTTITDGSGIIEKFEAAFCQLTGSGYALAMTNGTATLHSAYFAAGVGPGSEVIVPSHTSHPSAPPLLQCGSTPAFS